MSPRDLTGYTKTTARHGGESCSGHPVKTSADLYRTIDGEHYVCWTAGDGTPLRAALYRHAGVRCSRRGNEIFVHHMDQPKAIDVDRKYGAGMGWA